MNRRYYSYLAIIVVLLAIVIWAVLPSNNGIKIGNFQRSMETNLGLDLRGGLRVLLEADVPETTEIDAGSMEDAKNILENRANGLGVSETVFQVAGARRIVAEFPGVTDVEQVTNSLRQVGQLAFVHMGNNPVSEGDKVQVDLSTAGKQPEEVAATAVPTTAAEATPTGTEATPTPGATPTAAATETPTVYPVLMTGDQLSSVAVTRNQLGQPEISFELKPEGAQVFATYTTNHVGEYLVTVLDGVAISVASINSPITEGAGVLQGNFTTEAANALAVQLRYGSLPVPFKVVESRVIGPTLGQDSLNKSMLAGAIGMIIVVLFMTIYYRLPGGVAALAILFFGLITLALYKLIPVTLTLPGIAGFLLSTGSALDANILFFERMKEELRAGKPLGQALDVGWRRAWPSIRDSNIATVITSLILLWFGSTFGATIVKGFAVTLLLGVAISLFTAIIVTRTLLTGVLQVVKPSNLTRWFGI